MYKTTATIVNAYGIHCRPSGVISKAVMGYKGTIVIQAPDGTTVTPNSVLSLLSLGLTCGDTVTITVDGPDEEAMGEKLASLFSMHFDFER